VSSPSIAGTSLKKLNRITGSTMVVQVRRDYAVPFQLGPISGFFLMGWCFEGMFVCGSLMALSCCLNC